MHNALCLTQTMPPIDGRSLKHIGEVSPAVLKVRMQRCSQSANSPCGGPSALLRAMALADDRHSPSPVTPDLGPRSESLSKAQSTSDDLASKIVNTNSERSIATPAQERNATTTPCLRGRQSAPAKLHPRPQNALQGMDSEASSSSLISAKGSGQSHPLACSSSSKAYGQKPGFCHQRPGKPVNPEVSGREAARRSSSTDGSSCQTPSETPGKGESAEDETVSKTAQFPGSEEARKLRQEQQRLRKEEWRRKYGLGAKRHSEGSVPASEHGGGGVVAKEASSVADDGFQVDELTTDGTFIKHQFLASTVVCPS